MKNILVFLTLVSFLVITENIFAQGASSLPVQTNPQMYSVGCTNGIHYDDGTYENGYSFNPGYGWARLVMQITPTSYPYNINQVCLGLTRTSAGTANFTFNIVIYSVSGGQPGTLVDSIGGITATNVPVWPTVTIYDFTNLSGIPPLTSGSYFVGISFDPNTQGSHYVGADESSSTTLVPGYGYIQGAWGTLQSFFPSYKAMSIRVESTGPAQAHDISTGPFLSLPLAPLINVGYPIKTKVTNFGTSTETSIPVKFFINGTLTTTLTVPTLAPNQADSVSYTWTPTAPGVYNLMYVSALATDTNRVNDTVKTAIQVYTTPPPVCEGFNSTNFPPTNWTASGTGVSYLSRMAPSGYNLGVGSVRFNAWSAGTGMEGDLITPTFASPSGAHDTLFFDYAYCPYFTNDEQLVVSTSTNAGTSWTVLLTMHATDLTTTTSCANSEFTPSSASDWANKRLIMPQSTNKVKFAFISAFGNDIWADSMCVKPELVGVYRNPTSVPEVYSLSQNYPNPFNPTTMIQFALPKSGNVELKVYDMLGKEVATLVNETKQAGNYSVQFKGDDLASGVYFYSIKAGDFTATKKMLLVK